MIVKVGWEFNMILARIFGPHGVEITKSVTPKLFEEINRWWNENINDKEYKPDWISLVEFPNEEDYNLFRLFFKDKCYTLRLESRY